MSIVIDGLTAGDWPAVAAIYLEGIATGNATFETAAPEWSGWDAGHLPHCRLAAREHGKVLGWAALSRVSGRCAYAGVAEVSVYVAEPARGRGIGLALLQALMEASEAAGIWTLWASIFPANEASIAIHKKVGFRLLGVRERIGCMNGQWRDVMLMERRSAKVGV